MFKYAQLFKLSVAVIMLSALAACNTVEGFGKDVQKAGSSLEKAGNGD